MGAIYAWIKSIVIFLIVITIITNLLGKSDFKKYVNVVTGMLLVVLTITPILKWLHLSDEVEFHFNSNEFELEKKELTKKVKYAKSTQKHIILESYKEKIKEQVNEILRNNDLFFVSCKVSIEENEHSKAFATLQELNVTASYRKVKKEQSQIPQIQIDKIMLSQKKEEKPTVKTLSPMEIHIKNELSDFYNIKADNINISIQGG